MIMDCEIFDIVCKMMEGISVDEETLTLDTIREVGPGGTFLTQKHTKVHMRELWLSTLIDRRPCSEWKEKKDEARGWTRHRAKKILGTHKPEPLESRLIEVPLGQGRIILLGLRVQYRGQTVATFKLLFNSLFYGAAKP
jgi:trimethylamine--corrinoid protein Co-methyltransferase